MKLIIIGTSSFVNQRKFSTYVIHDTESNKPDMVYHSWLGVRQFIEGVLWVDDTVTIENHVGYTLPKLPIVKPNVAVDTNMLQEQLGE